MSLRLDFHEKVAILPEMVITAQSVDGCQVGFLLIDGFALMSYSAAAEPLRAANLLAGRRLYDVRNIPASGAEAVSSSGAVIRADGQVGEHVDFDYLFIVAGGEPTKFNDPRIFQWLRHLSRRGVILGGVSGGPVVLAASGLMAKRRMTVHWEHAASLAEIAPGLALERSLFVFDRDRITCAGGTAPLDMMHALIAEHHGNAFARQVSDWFMHTDVRPPRGPQRAGLTERYGTTNPAIVAALEAMENNLGEPLTLGQLSALASTGPRQLNRLFAHFLGRSTMTIYRQLRLNRAANLLAHSTLTITEIALATGFASSAHFSRLFSARYGAPPSHKRR